MRMHVLACLAIGCLFSGSMAAAEDPEQMKFVQESRTMVMAFATKLKGELQAAIAEGGPVHAIKVCSVKAPEIARDLSQSPQWTRRAYQSQAPQSK